MVDNPTQKSEYTENVEQSLKDFSKSSSDKSNYDGTYLFFSFDLVNSTAFKNKENNWSEIFDQFFIECKKEMTKLFPLALTWKLIGDEILFYLRVNSEEELYNSPKNTFTVLTNCISFLNTLQNTKSFLSIKATIWAANASDSKETSSNKIIIERDFDNEILDFLGTDIDIGFRISKYALNSVLVVEAKLACLLTKLKTEMQNEHISNYMRIVSYEQLKGVWDNRYYPIVWYKDNWTYSNNMFVYDDKYNSAIVQRIETSKGESLEDVSKLTKIFIDLDKIDRVKSLQDNIIKRESRIQKKISREKLSELHIVAICINSKNEILVAKRTEKDTLPNRWEFGCSQFRLDYIQNDPLPIGTYQFKKAKENDRIVPGIIFVCRIISGEDEIKLDESKHSKYRFINRETYRDIMNELTVDDFEKRIRDTYSLLDKLEKEPSHTQV